MQESKFTVLLGNIGTVFCLSATVSENFCRISACRETLFMIISHFIHLTDVFKSRLSIPIVKYLRFLNSPFLLHFVAVLKSQRDLSEKLKRKREQRLKKLEMEQAAEKDDFDRKVSYSQNFNITRVLPYLIPIGVIMVYFSTYTRPCVHKTTCANQTNSGFRRLVLVLYKQFKGESFHWQFQVIRSRARHSELWLRLEQLLRFSRALQSLCVHPQHDIHVRKLSVNRVSNSRSIIKWVSFQ